MHVSKTAVSLPPEVFAEGERLAQDLGISRSELYARALRTLFRERKIVEARACVDQAIADTNASADIGGLHAGASQTIKSAARRGESAW